MSGVSLLALGAIWGAAFGLVLQQAGVFRWAAMAGSFLRQQARPEARRLLLLRVKLAALKALANEISRTEARVAEVERGMVGGGRGGAGQAEGG